MAHVKIKQDEKNIYGTVVEVDGTEVNDITSLQVNMSVDSINTIQITQVGDIDIDIEADVKYGTIDYLSCEVDKLELGDNDILVLKHPGVLSKESQKKLLSSIKEVCGEDRRAVILEEGMQIGVIEKS